MNQPQPIAIRIIQALITEAKAAGLTHLSIRDLETALAKVSER